MLYMQEVGAWFNSSIAHHYNEKGPRASVT